MSLQIGKSLKQFFDRELLEAVKKFRTHLRTIFINFRSVQVGLSQEKTSCHSS
jgi:hypothetical protein